MDRTPSIASCRCFSLCAVATGHASHPNKGTDGDSCCAARLAVAKHVASGVKSRHRIMEERANSRAKNGGPVSELIAHLFRYLGRAGAGVPNTTPDRYDNVRKEITNKSRQEDEVGTRGTHDSYIAVLTYDPLLVRGTV
jgi:hypothetical protein